MIEHERIFVAGHRGMVGAAIVRALKQAGCRNIVTRTHSELDLTNQVAVNSFFREERPTQVYLAAARVGGIYANNAYPAEFIYNNTMIAANVIHAAYMHGASRLLFLGSSCIYPKHAPQPMSEDALLTGRLESTNEPYAIAKIAGIKLCESYGRQYGCDYRSVMPTNLYGPGDNYDLANSHVLPALIRKFHLAKLASQGDVRAILADEACYGEIPAEIKSMIGFEPRTGSVRGNPVVWLWGTGKPCREFLHVDDMAAASLFVMGLGQDVYQAHTSPMQSHLNVGYGSDVSIEAAARVVADVVGYEGRIHFDPSKPDGAPRKLMDSTRINRLGWAANIGFEDGVSQVYAEYTRKYR